MFAGGFGDRAFVDRVIEQGLKPLAFPIEIETRPAPSAIRGLVARELTFASPRSDLALPPGASTARVLHLSAGATGTTRSAAVVLAGSREEGYRLRQSIWSPLARDGVDVLLLENPYYGTRRARGQRSASLDTVADQLRMNVATVAEAAALVEWLAAGGCERIAVTGYSMGGAMAALTGTFVRRAIAVVPIAAGLSPAPIYTEGLLSRSVDFDAIGRDCGGVEHARDALAAVFDAASLAKAAPPVATEAAIVVACRRDGYVFAEQSEALAARWNCELRFVDAGHVSAIFTGRGAMRGAVRDALAALTPRAT